MHCTAAPAVPLVRLSIAPTATRRPARSSTVTWRCTAFEPSTAWVCGHWPGGSTWTNGSSAYALTYAARASSAVTPPLRGAEQVARMPRGIGTSTGVKLTSDARGSARSRACGGGRRRRRTPRRCPSPPSRGGWSWRTCRRRWCRRRRRSPRPARRGRRPARAREPARTRSGSSRGPRPAWRRRGRRGGRGARGGRRARCRRARSRRTRAQASGSASRKSAPQSTTSTSSPSASAIACGGAVRQRQEHHVVAGEGLGAGRLEDPLGQRREVRLEGAEGLPRVAGAGERADLDARVPEQQAQQLAAGVPARSGHRCSYLRHVHDYTVACIFMRTRVDQIAR